jgi:hypothetical protein
MMKRRKTPTKPRKPAKSADERGRVKKTLELIKPSMERAKKILGSENRPRSLTRLIEDLLDAEYTRMFEKEKKA